MKFTNIFKDMVGIELFPCISLLLFVVFFLSVTYYVYSIHSDSIKEFENLPLDNK